MGNYNANPAPQLPKFRTIAFDYLLVKQTNLKIDQFSTATDHKVYHFARKIGSTRLQFLVEPDDVPP